MNKNVLIQCVKKERKKEKVLSSFTPCPAYNVDTCQHVCRAKFDWIDKSKLILQAIYRQIADYFHLNEFG